MQISTLLSIKTGGCPEDCAYCPQAARYDTGVKAEKLMEVEAVLAEARAAKAAGASRFCMGAAWRSPKDRDLDAVCAMVEGVKALGLESCATLGMLDEAQARAQLEVLKRCGVTGVAICLLNAYLNPAHEIRLKALVHEVLGEVECSISREVYAMVLMARAEPSAKCSTPRGSPK